jgi:ASC-1-like (ASCH) protein/tRNA(Arg) A34 adenosine deaminase TadA
MSVTLNTTTHQEQAQSGNDATAASVASLPQRLLRRVLTVRHFPSFAAGLSSLPLGETLPDVGSIEEGEAIYAHFYTLERQRCRGVVFIESEDAQGQQQPASIVDWQASPRDFEAVVTARRALRRQLAAQQSRSSQEPQEVRSAVQRYMDALHLRRSSMSQPPPNPFSSPPARPPQRFLSLWLQPREGTPPAATLGALVRRVSDAHKQAPFAPHCTLATFPWAGGPEHLSVEQVLDGVRRALRASGVTEDRALHLRPLAPCTHPHLRYVTLVLLLQRSPTLMALRSALWKELLTPLAQTCAQFGLDPERFPTEHPYMPHLSILYDSRQALSPLQREEVLERELGRTGELRPASAVAAGAGVASTSSSSSAAASSVSQPAHLQVIDVGSIALVETTHERYDQWQDLGRVELPATDASIAVDHGQAALEPSPPPSDPAWFVRVLDGLEHNQYLRLAQELHDDARPAAVLVLDGQVVLTVDKASPSAAGADATPHLMEVAYAKHIGGEQAAKAPLRHDCIHLLQRMERLHEGEVAAAAAAASSDAASSSSSSSSSPPHVGAADDASTALFFSRARRARMVLYALHEPCLACQHVVQESGVHVVMFGRTDKVGCAVEGGTGPRALSSLLVLGPMLKAQ